MEQLLPILLSKDYKYMKPVFPTGVPREFNSSWFQFIHDIIQLDSGLRDCYLIDYSVPEYNNLIKFIKSIKPKLPQLFKELSLLVINDFQYFLINRSAFISRLKKDIESNFNSYVFINVSPCQKNAIICNDNQYHKDTLKIIAEVIIKKLEKENIPSNKLIDWFTDEKEKNLFLKVYPPLLSGWLCEYPVIYCNSATCERCSEIQLPLSFETESKWNANCITMTELTRYEVYFDKPTQPYQHLNSFDNLKRVLSFTVPSILLRDDDNANSNNNNEINSNTIIQILKEWNEKTKQKSTKLKRKVWDILDTKVTNVSNITVNL